MASRRVLDPYRDVIMKTLIRARCVPEYRRQPVRPYVEFRRSYLAALTSPTNSGDIVGSGPNTQLGACQHVDYDSEDDSIITVASRHQSAIIKNRPR